MTTREVLIRQGETLFREGDAADAAYLIESGRIEISARSLTGTRLLAILESGDIVGEMAIIDGSPRSATATALEDLRLTRVSKESILERMDKGDDIIAHLLAVLIARLRATNQSVLSDSTLPRFRGKLLDDLMADQAIREASRSREFIPFLQPIVRLQDGTVVGYEALARLRGQDGILRVPDNFISVAERTRAVIGIDICILTGACEALSRLNALRKGIGLPAVQVSVNLSGAHFMNSEIVTIVEQAMTDSNLGTGELSIEITETVLLTNQWEAALVLSRFRDMGVRVCLDDFGTGYSNLAYLNLLPIDRLKIDKSFVWNSESGQQGSKIASAIVALARSLEMESVAEGIETTFQAARMSEIGCDFAQGYLFGRPAEEQEIAATLTAIALR